MAAFTAAFPEMIDNQRYWWFTSLWCDSRHQGKGFGLVVIGSLAEVYGKESILDRWGARETVEIFSCLGNRIVYTSRYILGCKINRQTTKGNLVYCVRSIQKGLHRLIELPGKYEEYTLQYLTNIDDETYAFLQFHRNKDLFLRTQPMLNWILQYSFTQACPLLSYTQLTTPFAPAKATSNSIYAVQVRNKERLIGVYIMKHTEDDLHVLYLYYDDSAKNKVFASICDHVKRLNIVQFITDNEDLANYMLRTMYFPKNRTEKIHFAYPGSINVHQDATLQYGDGDGFTAE